LSSKDPDVIVMENGEIPQKANHLLDRKNDPAEEIGGKGPRVLSKETKFFESC
jgi:hypothetical protein